jgi:23S rRNA (uracil1939-C5)-methyltransferase
VIETPGNAVIRIAARGDGVTAEGRHVPFGVPGDVVAADGTLAPGPHHVDPPCRHFPKCGGCQLQHADEAALAQFVTERVAHAAEGHGIVVDALLPTHLSPPRSRRRATLHGLRTGQGAVLGFREAGSHRIVDTRECHVLRPELFALVGPMRALIARWGGKAPMDVSLTLADQGLDCVLGGIEPAGLEQAEALQAFAQDHGLARFAIDYGYGAETLWEPEPVTATLSGVAVALPSGAFLQATVDGEAVLIDDARSYLAGAGGVADLFAGLGTFALALTEPARVLAVEASRDAHLACKAAADAGGKPVHSLHRDLFRNPLPPEELNRFDAVLLDPPRAGAREQVATIAASALHRVVYVSCNPSSWARDARTLVDAGFRLAKLRPVGQFRWSTHVELTSLFVR